MPLALRAGLRLTRWGGPLLASPALKRSSRRGRAAAPPGPDADERARGSSLLWAEARDGAGRVVELRLRAPEPYELTSWTALALAERARFAASYRSDFRPRRAPAVAPSCSSSRASRCRRQTFASRRPSRALSPGLAPMPFT